MSIKVEYRNGVFEPLEEVRSAAPGEVYVVFSRSELERLAADLPWLAAAERGFTFWDNDEDAVYDDL